MHDAGKILNPKLADGQIKGAFAQGIGAALLEQLSYSADGAFETGTFADYCPPYATDMPELLILHDEHPSPLTPTGAKGLGEGNCMSTPVCIANAISDAIGVEVDRSPSPGPRCIKYWTMKSRLHLHIWRAQKNMKETMVTVWTAKDLQL